MPKNRVHNEWFRPVSCGGRKSCPNCKAKLAPGESIWSWGNYVIAKWRTIMHFCKDCFPNDVAKKLTDHTDECGCSVQFITKGAPRPEWLTVEKPACKIAA